MKESSDITLGCMLRRLQIKGPYGSVSTAVQHFTQTYSSDNTWYCYLPSWITDDILNCDALFSNHSIIIAANPHFDDVQ